MPPSVEKKSLSQRPQPVSAGNQSTVTPMENNWISTMAVRNTGMEIPTVLMPIKNRDNRARGRIAANTPIGTDSNPMIRLAAITSYRVAGKCSPITFSVGSL